MPEFAHQATSSHASGQKPGSGDVRFRLGPVRIVLLLLLLLLVWATSMVVYLPVGWVWHQASPHVPLPPQVRVEDVAGRLWDGTARIHWQDLSVQLGWSLQLSALRHGQLPLEWRVVSGPSRLEGSLTGTRDRQLRLQVRRGEIDLGQATRIAAVQNVSVGGVVTLENLLVVWSEQGGWSEATGRGRWPGGLVTWPMGGQVQRAQLPPLKADITMEQGDIRMRLQDQAESRTAVTMVMPAAEPVVEVAIRRHWLDLLGLRFGSENGNDPDEVLFNVRHNLAP
ncbi:MAG: hypothetical protein R3296_10910 [Oleiphilaceae bacterium]|nr:hypothetical protein [Oleiphilaceae bacterium]